MKNEEMENLTKLAQDNVNANITYEHIAKILDTPAADRIIIRFDNGDLDVIPRAYLDDISWCDRGKDYTILIDYEMLENWM